MAFMNALTFPCLVSPHRVAESKTRLFFRNVNSCNGGPVILSWPGNQVGMRTRSLCLFAALDDGNKENNKKSDAIDVEYYDRHAKACARDTEPLHLVEKMMEDCRKAQRVIQVESVRAQQELAAERYDGCCEGQLVKMTISGLQQPVGIEIADAAMELGAEKLSLLVFEAHKDAFRKTVEAFQDKVRSLEAYLDMPEQAFREGIL